MQEKLLSGTSSMRRAALNEAVVRLAQQHTRSAYAFTPIFMLPRKTHLDSFLVHCIATTKLSEKTLMTREAIDCVRMEMEQKAKDRNFVTLGVFPVDTPGPFKRNRTIHAYYFPDISELPPSTQKRIKIRHSYEERLLQAITHFHSRRLQSQSVWAIQNTLFSTYENFMTLMLKIDEMRHKPIIFVFSYNEHQLDAKIAEEIYTRTNWAFFDVFLANLAILKYIHRVSDESEKNAPVNVKALNSIEGSIKGVLTAALNTMFTVRPVVRFVQNIPFQLCGAQCLWVVKDSDVDLKLRKMSKPYATWLLDPSASAPSLGFAIWQTPALLVDEFPLFPLSVCVLQNTDIKTIDAAFQQVYVTEKMNIAVYPLRGKDIKPVVALQFQRAFVHMAIPVSTASQTNESTSQPNSMLSFVKNAFSLKRKQPLHSVAYTAVSYHDAIHNAGLQPLVFLCDDLDNGGIVWLSAFGRREIPFADGFLSSVLYSIDCVHAIKNADSKSEDEDEDDTDEGDGNDDDDDDEANDEPNKPNKPKQKPKN
jgi:hypothetical protein